ncbi:MAG: hypothetical protein ACLFUB_05205, partial [Cyclobacteriaceae bacterium]
DRLPGDRLPGENDDQLSNSTVISFTFFENDITDKPFYLLIQLQVKRLVLPMSFIAKKDCRLLWFTGT